MLFGVEALAGLRTFPNMATTAHHPPHLYLDDTWYMLTAATYQKQCVFHTSSQKEILRDQLHELVREFHLVLRAWVILDNHYHLLLKTHVGKDLFKFFGRLHGRTSFEFNRLDRMRGRQVWHNYWDTCIRSENDYWLRFNYIHHNPVKHGYVDKAEDWPFSSYPFYLRTKGMDWANDVWMRFPVIDFTDLRDEFSLHQKT